MDEIKETVVTPEVEFSAPEEETTVVETPEVVEEATVTEEFTVVEADTEAEEVVEEVAEEEAAEETEAQVEEEEETETDAPEATDYSAAFTELFNEHEALKAEYAALKEEVDSLREYKNSIERSEKEELINKFYMLSEDDKKDVMDNIDSYSLEEIEAKLCVACYRKGLGFENKTEESEEVKTYNLQVQDATPAWIKAVEERSKK